MPLQQSPFPARRLLSAAALAAIVAVLSDATAQVFDPGPSDPSLFTNGVFNVPPDAVPALVGNLQQLNVSSGGTVGDFFDADFGGEVNISGGNVGIVFRADSGSEVNISGGNVGDGFNARSGSRVSISGGHVGSLFDARSGSQVNISGGNVGSSFNAFSGSEVDIAGGVVGRDFDALSGSDVELIGGEFRLNGVAYTGSTISLADGDIFTGVLQDGSTSLFATTAGDDLHSVTLTSVGLPTVDVTPIVVNTASPNRPTGLRAGQTLTLQDGGLLNDNFEATNGTVNVEGGDLGNFAGVVDTEVNISGGDVGDFFHAYSGSQVNISGGNVGSRFSAFSGGQVNIYGGNVGRSFSALSGSQVNISGGNVGGSFLASLGSEVSITGGNIGSFFHANLGSVVNILGGEFGHGFRARTGSEINLFGTEFLVDGVALSELQIGEAFTLTDRDVLLSGTLADGSALQFELLAASAGGYFEADATLTLTLVAPLSLPGDFNGDGVVDLLDLDILGANFGSVDATVAEGDANGDGVVDLLDLDVFGANFGAGGSQSVPEPTTAALLTLAVAVLRRARASH